MCIALISTVHPDYAYIILANRDEYLTRPTQPLSRWPEPASHVYAGRDLQHPAHGTWLGITDHGRLAILTNFREAHEVAREPSAPSRGEIAKSFLELAPAAAEDEGLEAYAKRFLEDEGDTWKNLGGFSFIFGDVRPWRRGARSLGIMSNRTPDVRGVIWVAESEDGGASVLGGGGKTIGQTCALSNSAYGDDTWPKVRDGERLVDELLGESIAAGEEEGILLERLFGLLSRNTLPVREDGQSWLSYIGLLRNSIFIPPVGEDEAGRPLYGTQKQTVILVRNDGKTTIIEKTLFDNEAQPVREEQRFDFDLKGSGRTLS